MTNRSDQPVRTRSRQLSRQMVLPLVVVPVLLMLLGGLVVVELSKRDASMRLEQRALLLARSINYAAETIHNEQELIRLVNVLGAEQGVQKIVVVGGTPPVVIASTENRWIGLPLADTTDRTMADDLHTMIQTGQYKFNARRGTRHVDCAVPLLLSRPDRSLQSGAVWVQIDSSGVQRLTSAWARLLIAGILVMLATIAGMAWWLLNRRVLIPIEGMIRSIRDGGEFPQIPEHQTDEIGLLARAINDANRRARASAEGLAVARERAESALREIAALRRALDEHSILSVADASGRIVDINTGFCRISGYNREELIGQDHRVLNSGHHPRSFWVEVWRQIARGKAWRGEICNRRKDGSFYWVDSTIVPYIGPDGRIEKYVSIRFDITTQKRSEHALQSARRQAEAASRSKSDFLANMSHEIRTPMTAILGFTELLGGDGAELTPEQRDGYIDTIRRNGEHLLALINDILDVSKIEAGRMTVEQVEVRPIDLIREVMGLMSVKADAKGLCLRSEAGPGVPSAVVSDPVRLRQILVNLVGNAIKFTEHGEVCVTLGTDSGRLYFEICDTGIGMSGAQSARLFEAFTQADNSTTRKHGGTGLGLHISQRLASMLGGEITVHSEPDRGSTFRLTIRAERWAGAPDLCPGPIKPAPRAEVAVSRPISDLRPLAGRRVLLAEDGPDNTRLISFHLRRAGAEVVAVENGRLAMEELTRDRTAGGELDPGSGIDLVITDIQMPEMDGYELAGHLRRLGWRRPIIALTAHAMAGDRERCMAAGCDAYCTKPVQAAELVEVCRAALAAEEHGQRPGLAA